MSNFTALNVEPDENFVDEVDNTREIQIEEALKLYQNALKLHSQGPKYYEQAAASYDALFKSEIFRYPESTTEFARSDDNSQVDNELDFSYNAGADLAASASDGSPSSLPQILYLAYKNHGQFIMDYLKINMRRDHSIPKEMLLSQAHSALLRFCEALARDESDTELWRRAARVGVLLGSHAIARYCLEAAVEVDDDPTQEEVEPAGIEEGFAGMQLKEHLEVLSDEVALSHPIMAPYNKKSMSMALKKYMDPYPFLPDLTQSIKSATADSGDVQESRIVVEVADRSWCALGEALWRACIVYPGSGMGVIITMPDVDRDMTEVPVLPVDSKVRPVQRRESGFSTKEEAPSGNGASSFTSLITQHPPREDDGQAEPSSANSNENNGEPDSSLGRKRSQSVAGIQETADEETGGQKRSRRIRNRDTTGSDCTPLDSTIQFKEQLREVQGADEHVFNYISTLLKKLDITDLGTIEDLQDAASSNTAIDRNDKLQNTAVRDLRDIMRSWTDNKATVLMSGGGLDVVGSSNGGANAGLLAFLEHSKAGLKKLSERPLMPPDAGLADFMKVVNEKWWTLQDVAYEFLRMIHPTYCSNLWPDTLKHTVCRLINRLDAEIYERLQGDVDHLRSIHDSQLRTEVESFVQMLFEIHLDIYASITDPNSVIDFATRIKEKESVDRWSIFASDLIAQAVDRPLDDLIFRFLWSSAFFASMADGKSREHTIACWSDLQLLLERSGNPKIELENNAVMPEISAAAADREISKLTSMDFFLNLFQSDKSDPLAIIETLEPVLDPQSVGIPSATETTNSQKDDEESPRPAGDSTAAVPIGLRDMWKFLQGGSTSLRLFLWQRLREAYQSINYTTKVFSCHLKSLEIIVADLRSTAYVDGSVDSRQHSLLGWLKTLDDLLVKSLTLALNDQTAFEIVDDAHIRSSSSAVAQLSRLLHSAAIFEDGVRVGMVQLPRAAAYSPQGTFGTALIKLREMQVRSWALLYTLIRDGMAQNHEMFPTMESDLADYMAAVHYSLGLRKCCKVSNKIFLKMMKVELVRMKTIERWEDYIGQVLFDLYGIRLGAGLYELLDHACPTEPLDKRTTLAISDRVISLANSMPMKDLLKAELRPTIEKMQQAIGMAKSTTQMQHNLRNYTEYLKSSIQPLRMIEAFRGKVCVDSVPFTTPESPLADKGWYFLLGMISLTKFRSQKRLSPGATDDLKVAASFFRLQLQFTSELWETWYRMAQCFDAELEEDILWSAEKLNQERGPLIQLQRSSIHCYVMALSTAVRCADSTFETASKLSDMYHDFATRIYSSTREPFKMEAFSTCDFEKHFSGPQGMYKKRPTEISKSKAWRYASGLLQRALKEMPNAWMSHFLLGKCLWKMYTNVNDEYDEHAKRSRPSMVSVINSFVKAIETVPKPKDSRSEPILEPHYKLMSIAHKLVILGDLEHQAAADLLQRQPYAIRKGEPVKISEVGGWGAFILESIRHLRNADKSNWHHRMIYRCATIVCSWPEPGPADFAQANAARAELKDSMFTKTMVVQVWKPEYERPGRHCVYMERYVRFMVQLLLILEDKQNMEALVKRVRKKQVDYYHFTEVWTECCSTYMKLIRGAGKIAINQDDRLKNYSSEDFGSIADALEAWCNDSASSHPVLDCLREASELKKLNSNLMKPTAIDDLINDAWATLFLHVGVTLPRAATLPPPSPTNETRAQGPMSLNNLVSNMDGAGMTQLQPLPEVTARPRNKVVSRREILRRAEASVSRVPEAPRPFAPSRARLSDQSLLVSSNTKSPVTGPVQPRVTAALRDRESNEAGVDSSAPGSLHDSADDESADDDSDLSDVPDPEEEPAPAMFPNLKGATANSGSEGDRAGSVPAQGNDEA